jgi:hypothetical protein
MRTTLHGRLLPDAWSTYPRLSVRSFERMKGGDLSGVETMLMTQANTLDMMFNQLARKAARSEYLSQMEANLRHALRAQAQCRATLEALAEIKNPRPVAFVRQANIANGPQQVNNGTATPVPHAHARETNEAVTNEVLTDEREAQRAATLDTGATKRAGREDTALASVAVVKKAVGQRCVSLYEASSLTRGWDIIAAKMTGRGAGFTK